ncbi:hypothetical protein [Streptomyces sp. NPDC059668]|uniref:hypothetical protein n=1 Tax=Streptomyces sp. NPDC059668 TaxID=3346900 RepID=UPI0036B6801A
MSGRWAATHVTWPLLRRRQQPRQLACQSALALLALVVLQTLRANNRAGAKEERVVHGFKTGQKLAQRDVHCSGWEKRFVADDWPGLRKRWISFPVAVIVATVTRRV